MDCPQCGALMNDVTDSWATFAEAEGAEYLASYTTIWHCPACRSVAGVDEDDVQWVIEAEEAVGEE